MFVEAMPGCFILNAYPWNCIKTISIQLFGAVSNASGGIVHLSTQRQTEQNAVAGNNVWPKRSKRLQQIGKPVRISKANTKNRSLRLHVLFKT